jgi:hypothetical protein
MNDFVDFDSALWSTRAAPLFIDYRGDSAEWFEANARSGEKDIQPHSLPHLPQ